MNTNTGGQQSMTLAGEDGSVLEVYTGGELAGIYTPEGAVGLTVDELALVFAFLKVNGVIG